MNRSFFILCFIFLGFQQGYAQEPYLDSLFSVSEAQTVTYAQKDGQDLIIDLYFPEADKKQARPAIIFMHGGGFSGGSPKNPGEVKFAKIAASKGYVVGLISYRLTRKGQSFGCDYASEGKMKTFQLAAEDFMDATEFIRANAQKYQIDTKKIIVGGSSAGAEAVLNAVFNADLIFQKNSEYSDENFAAVFSLAGALADVRYLKKEDAIPGIFFHGTDDNLVPYATAPHHYCKPSSPGYLVLDGSKTIVEKLKDLDESYLFYSFKGAKHEISGMPFKHLPEVFRFLKEVVLEEGKIQSTVYQ